MKCPFCEKEIKSKAETKMADYKLMTLHFNQFHRDKPLEERRQSVIKLFPEESYWLQVTLKIKERKEKQAKEKEGKNKPRTSTDLILTNDKKKGKEIIKATVKKTAIEHQEERARQAKEKKDREAKEKIKKATAKTVTDKTKDTENKKKKGWVWATLVMGLVALSFGTYLLIKKYKKELKQPKSDEDNAGETKESSGFWWLPNA